MRELGGLGEALALAAPREHATAALYASAGHDTMPFAFLHPSFLATRGVEQMTTPELYVYVDREEPRGRAARLRFEDERILIRTEDVEELAVAGFPAWLLHVAYSGDEPDETGSATILRLRATNQQVYRLCAEAEWSPDVFIGVKDGCRYGGQDPDRCENSLEYEGSPVSVLPRPPEWWVTEHFRHRSRGLGGEIGVGDVVRSPDPAFPVAFTKIALLSSQWGHRLDPLYGATVFRVKELARQLSTREEAN